MYTSQEQKTSPTCGLCGINLGVGFYYTCHVCGATYCYAHSPQKCAHQKVGLHQLSAAVSSKA